MRFHYLRPGTGDQLRDASVPARFKAIVAIEEELDPKARDAVCDWLVASGCLYMMAWGAGCEIFYDCVDETIRDRHDFGDIPVGAGVVTTWHENEPLSEVMWFARFAAEHSVAVLQDVVLVHLSSVDRREEFKDLFERTMAGD
ncbi:hypothetical protein [Labrenzia sp. VG12]|uniref:DUF7684 family protein n=1 Tax=Labrenzia sp. VG12 TaxID=2021862 RepID=UPI0012FDD206|nr:hypothetical protein [Labrenzia sp. VG12]